MRRHYLLRVPGPLLAAGVVLIGLAGSAGADQPPPRPPFTLAPVLTVTLGAPPAAPPAVDALTAYVPLAPDALVAVDLATGATRWRADVATALAPAAGGGLVIAAGDEMLTALDAATGEPRWRLPLPGGFAVAPALDTGWVLATMSDGAVLAIRANDGQAIWTRRLGAPAAARPALAADAVYIPLADGRVVALGLADGAPRWERAVGARPGAILPLDDRLFVGGGDGYFYCLKISNGDVRWRWRTGASIPGRAVVDERRVFYTAYDNVVRALDRNGGSQRWRQPLPLRPSGGPLLAGDVLLVAGVAAEIRAFWRTDGAVAGTFTAPDDLIAPPQLVPGRPVLFPALAAVTLEGRLQVLERRVEPPATPLPYPLGAPVPVTALTPD